MSTLCFIQADTDSVPSTGQGQFLAGGVYSIATEVFPDRFPTSELTNAYLVTGLVSPSSLIRLHYC